MGVFEEMFGDLGKGFGSEGTENISIVQEGVLFCLFDKKTKKKIGTYASKGTALEAAERLEKCQ